MRMLLTYSKDLSPSVSRVSRPLQPTRSTCSARCSAHRLSQSVLFKNKGRARDALLAVGPVLYVYKRIGDAAVGAAYPDAPLLSNSTPHDSERIAPRGGILSGRQSLGPIPGARFHSLVAAPFRVSENQNGSPTSREARGSLPFSPSQDGPAQAGWLGCTGYGCRLKPRRKPVASQAVGRLRSQTNYRAGTIGDKTPYLASNITEREVRRHERRLTKIDPIVKRS